MEKIKDYSLNMVALESGGEIEHCAKYSMDEIRMTHYDIIVSDAMCLWLRAQVAHGCLLGLALAILLRLQWKEIIELKFYDLRGVASKGVYIPEMIRLKDGTMCHSGHNVSGTWLISELIFERAAYLRYVCGYTAKEISSMPVVCGEDPCRVASEKELQYFASRWRREFTDTNEAKALCVSSRRGAYR